MEAIPLTIIKSDITELKVDAIVNAANSALKRGGGVCGAIFSAAGQEELQKQCDALGGCNPGKAVLTPGFGLPAKYIIHTVGPRWQGGNSGERETLQDCYFNSLALARERNIESIAFPLIATGIFGYPKEEALEVATQTIVKFLADYDLQVYLVIFDKQAFALNRERLAPIESFIEHYYRAQYTSLRNHNLRRCSLPQLNEDAVQAPAGLDDLLLRLDESFSKMLMRLIDAKGLTDVEVYKRANIDRKLFSKIRSKTDYAPKKKTAVALAIGLRLSLDETKDLLDRAGYSLSRSQVFDLIIEYFLMTENYNIYEINEALFHFDQPLLGGENVAF